MPRLFVLSAGGAYATIQTWSVQEGAIMIQMRKEQFGTGTFVHVIQRGSRQMPIVRNDTDRWRFLRLIRYVNDESVPRHWERDISPDDILDNFRRPAYWPAIKPYVSVIAYCLMDNHFHLLLQERLEGGVSKFIQRISNSMAMHHNARYGTSGTLFEGPYRARVVADDRHLQYLGAYINVKNPFERFPGGLHVATANFEQAYAFAIAYSFSSTADFAGVRTSSILDHALRQELFSNPNEFKGVAQELMLDRQEALSDGGRDGLFLEPWS